MSVDHNTDGVRLGGILLQKQGSPADFNRNTGVHHSLFMEFLEFPDILKPNSKDHGPITRFVAACKEVEATPTLTLECMEGLDSYNIDQVKTFAKFLADFETPIILRWNHEMNGSWYAWGQQPELYIEKFREFAGILRSHAPDVSMAWTPNQGWGYPWPGCKYHNASLDSGDPYTPYYPGDDVVDWVGISYYHWGEERGANGVPAKGKWGAANGIGNSVPNFHDVFAIGHNKPMMIAETSALFDLNDHKGTGIPEAEIKKAWIEEVYNTTDESRPRLTHELSGIRAIFWFSILKKEEEVGGEVDWRLDSNPEVASFYREMVEKPCFLV